MRRFWVFRSIRGTMKTRPRRSSKGGAGYRNPLLTRAARPASLAPSQPGGDPALRGFDVFEGGVRRPVEAAKPVFEKPFAGEIIVVLGQAHQDGHQKAVPEDEATFLVGGARRHAYGLQREGHAAMPRWMCR